MRGGFGLKKMWGLVAVCITVLTAWAVVADAEVPATPMTFPMNVMQDSASFTVYVNEEALIKCRCEWAADGRFASEYSISMAGQTVSGSTTIAVDNTGGWSGMTIMSPQGPVEVVKEDTLVRITALGKTNTVALKSSTLLYDNFGPCLMSQIILAYDQRAGGKQTFPLFIIPQALREISVERLEAVERNIFGTLQIFTTYRFGLPGVDMTVWTDDKNRICLGDVLAQKAAIVRNGYEALRIAEQPDSLLSQPKYEVAIDSGLGVPMRDGIKLATDIYRPNSEGQFPVILVRTPYKKEMNELQGKFYARRGYVYAVQDCRGRFSSPGTWEPFFNEPQDGYDAIEWLAAQPWASGKVGMIGGSYLGWVQWWAARETPPHLTTIIPNVAPPDPYFNIPYEYGSFFMMGAIWWAAILEKEATGDLAGTAMREINDKMYGRLLRHLPVVELDSIVMGKRNNYWRDWIAHPNNDAYWQRANFLDRLEKLNIPVFHQSGWYDGDGIGTKLNYLAMAKHGHQYQKMVVGPWGHSDQAHRLGPNGVDFGPNALVDMNRLYTRWLDRWLLGIDNGIDKEPLVSLFVMGSNQWLQGDRYPLPETQFTKYYLASKTEANSSHGDGYLSSTPADGASVDTFTYDPGDPTPDPEFYIDPDELKDDANVDSTKAKSVEESRALAKAYHAKVDQERRDILVYDSPPLAESLTIVGPISAVLYAATSAKDTDWIMHLSKIDEKGEIFPLVHGIIRARYRTSFSKPELVKPEKVLEYHLDLWHTGITVAAGQKLRIEVASAAFPMFSRNLNTGGHNETETKYKVAKQTIHHSAEYPSHILLPVIPSPKLVSTVGPAAE